MLTSDGQPWTGEDPNHLDRYRKDVPPGTAQWTEDGKYLWFTCPCGCGRLHCIPAKRNGNTYGWDFAGTAEVPTLTPSIQITTGCRWHGFLTNGQWKTH